MAMIDRRELLFAGTAAAVVAKAGWAQVPGEAPDQDDRIFTEEQSGDPTAPTESLLFNPIDIQRAVLGGTQAAFEPRIVAIRAAILTGSIEHLGKSRAANRAEIERWFDLFGLPFELNGKPLPFCATGLSYVAATLYARQKGVTSPTTSQLRNFLGDVDHHHFYPTPSVVDMKSVAVGKRRWVGRAQAVGPLKPQPGWLVIYDWNGDGHPDHVGLVEKLDGTTLTTIEFNTSDASATNGGTVARKQRAFNTRVQGFIRPELTRVA